MEQAEEWRSTGPDKFVGNLMNLENLFYKKDM